ncbi:hypothetical protein [Mycobacterium sp.]|uniref:hypothetical protein n=1 Tax=Mycobacterium sp. TaxID=1785 RepID=UPI0026064AF3|nr:hypothetical protein [Mycobacterium sp.]
MAKVTIEIIDQQDGTIDASMTAEPSVPVTRDEPGWPPTPAQRTGMTVIAALLDVAEQSGSVIVGATIDREPAGGTDA